MLFGLETSHIIEETISEAHSGRNEVALTFDACQNKTLSGYDEPLISYLIKSKTKATLFLGGFWAETHRKQTQLLARNPLFEIAQHSYKHPHFRTLTPQQISSDLSRAQTVINQVTGKTPRYFRPPYGEYDSKTITSAQKLGLKTVLWSVVSGDPDKKISANQLAKSVVNQAKPGSIIIMHMNGRGWHTAEALPAIIEGLKKRGLKPVTLSELLRK